MPPPLPHPFAAAPRIVMMFSLTVALGACSGASAPAGPSIVQQPSTDVSSIANPAALTATSQTVNRFPLVNGTFTLALSASDGSVGTVNGTYTGEAVVAEHGSKSASLDIQMTEASGIGSTISGIDADGTGAFIDEGDVTLTLLLTSSLTKSPLRVRLRGTSSVSCSASHRILVTLHGTDSTRGSLDITADLQHEVERTVCGL